MSTAATARAGLAMALRHELCDKCGTRMWLQGAGHGFERWCCPHCLQVVGIDRDPQVGGRFQLDRGHPWRYAPFAFNS
jgi:hypothetical protein